MTHSAHPDEPVGLVLHNPIRYDLRLMLMSRGREGAFRRSLVELAGVNAGGAVLDIGCGTGSLAIAAARVAGSNGSVTGIDPSAEMVGRAQAKARRSGLNATFQEGIAQHLPFADASFDVVMCTFVLHQLPHQAWQAAKSEAARVLKPGGRLFIVDIGGEQSGHGPHHRAVARHVAAGHSVHLFNLLELAPLFAGAGLTQIGGGAVPFRLSFFENVEYVLLQRS